MAFLWSGFSGGCGSWFLLKSPFLLLTPQNSYIQINMISENSVYNSVPYSLYNIPWTGYYIPLRWLSPTCLQKGDLFSINFGINNASLKSKIVDVNIPIFFQNDDEMWRIKMYMFKLLFLLSS